MRWFKRKKKGDELSVGELTKLSRAVLDIITTETGLVEVKIMAFNVSKGEAEAYGKKLDKVLAVRGKPDSGGTSEWIGWDKGRMHATIFIKD